MAERRVLIQCGRISLEGLIEESPGERAVVVTHPHPLYGGDMNNNVVAALAEAYRERDYTTLRFNFRGAGQSGGSFDEGTGEQEDVSSALDFLYGRGKSSIDLAGYSFGAWVNALGSERFEKAKRFVMVSPPVGFLDFSFFKYTPNLKLVITGSNDEIAPVKLIEKMHPIWNKKSRFEVIQGADHFYWGKDEEIKRTVQSFLDFEEQCLNK